MEESTLTLIIAILALIISSVVFIQSRNKKTPRVEAVSFTTRPLQLQAYERLVLLCERIALPNLISRVSQPGLSAREMQMILIETIKQEYEYNISQQVYVSNAAWDAVRNLRDQNMLMINKIANVLPPESKASDLNKSLLEVVMSQSEKALHSMALETLNAEARTLLR